MVSVSALLANRKNALKSTGPVTAAGNATASRNAVRHELLSARLLLDDEDHDELQGLLHDLVVSLHPVGGLEDALIERMAGTLWRQHRLIRAETAGIELSRRAELATNREQVQLSPGRGLGQSVTTDEVQPLTNVELQAIAKFAVLTPEHDDLVALDLETLPTSAPILYEELQDDAAAEDVTVSEFVSRFESGLREWIRETLTYHRTKSGPLQRRADVLAVAALVQFHRSASIDQESLTWYQTALDNDLVKTVKTLREAQEWRLHSIEVTADVLDGAAVMSG